VAETARRPPVGGRSGSEWGDGGRSAGAPGRAAGPRARSSGTSTPADPCPTYANRVVSANAYLGRGPCGGAAQRRGHRRDGTRHRHRAHPRAHDHAFGWRPDAWDLLAAGTVAGHTIECGAQCSGATAWWTGNGSPTSRMFGYPIVEAAPDGTFEITKHPGTGGRISVAGVKGSSCYEMGNPAEYITPDGIADFTTIRLEQAGKDRVRVSVSGGGPPPTGFKVSIGLFLRLQGGGHPGPTRGRTPTGRLRPRTAFSGSGSPISVSSSSRADPSSWAPTPPTARWPRRERPPRSIAGSAAADRRPVAGQGRRRAVHARDCTADPQRTAQRHRVRRRTTEAGGDRGVLAALPTGARWSPCVEVVDV